MVDGRAPPAQPIRAGRSLKIERLLDVATQTADRFVPSAVRVMVCPVSVVAPTNRTWDAGVKTESL